VIALLARVLLCALAAGGSTVVLLGQLGRERFMLDQLNSGLSVLVPGLAVIAALALRGRDRVTAAVAGLGILVGGYQLGSVAVAPVERAQGAGPTIKLLTLSTYHSNPNPDAIRRVVMAEAPDIALLQETNRETRLVVESLLPGFHRAKSCQWRHCSLTILSRWPLTRMTLDYGRDRHFPDLLAAEVAAPFGALRVINVHMPRPSDVRSRTFIGDLAKVSRTAQDRPLIVGGDFNAATGSFGLERFARDSGLRRLEGFVPTYPANRPVPAFIGIDHVFADARWRSLGCHRTEAGGSDHYGIACTLALQTRPSAREVGTPGAVPVDHSGAVAR